MRIRSLILAAGLLAHLHACGPQPAPAPEALEAEPAAAGAASGEFDWEAWSRVVNASPCDWLPEAFVSELIGAATPGVLETSRTETACAWKNADGTALFTAAIVSFDSAANLSSEREAQVQETRNGQRFRQLNEAAGTVTAILRTDRIKLMMFPNSDAETAVIVLSGHPVLNEPDEVRGIKVRRAETFARELIRVHGL